MNLTLPFLFITLSLPLFSFGRQPAIKNTALPIIPRLEFSVGHLEPAFSETILSYTLSLSNSQTQVCAIATSDTFTTLSYWYNDSEIGNGCFIAKPGGSILKIRGSNTSNDGSREYIINVFRDPWKFHGNGPFEARDGAAILEFKNQLWLLGGWKKDGVDSDIWVSEDGITWKDLGIAPWSGRHCAGAVVFKDKIWILSGDGLEDVWSSPNGVDWVRELESAPWGKRYAPYVLTFDNKIWLMGGQTFYSTPTRGFNDVWSSADGVNWKLVKKKAPWKPRAMIHGQVVFQNKIWIIGGGLKGLHQPIQYNDVWSTTDGFHWKKEAKRSPWAPRYHFSTNTFNGKIWISDGSLGDQNNLSNEVWSSANGKNWTRLPNIPWQPTHATSLVPFRNSLFLIGGYIRNEIWELNLED
jgi:hypothetical protein